MSNPSDPSSPSNPSSPASAKASNPPKKTLPKLKASLEKVVFARGNVYTRKTAVIFYWDDDDTGATKDAESLKAVLTDSLDITPEIHVLKTKDLTPAWTVRGILNDLLAKFHCYPPSTSGDPIKTFFMFAYIGHGKIVSNGQLAFASSAGKTVTWSTIQHALFNEDDTLKDVDAFCFLDCCYSGTARSHIERTSQILAASGAKEFARSRNEGISFTQRFSTAIRALQNRGGPMMTTASLFEEIMKHKPGNAATPKLSNLGGIKPISLPFKKITPASPSQRPIQSPSTGTTEKHVLVKLTVDGQSHEALREMHEAIRVLPAEFKVSIVEAFQTDRSALILLRMTWEAWARIDAAVPLDIVGTVIGPSLLQEKRGLSLQA
jgi:hypothetical protein